MKSKRYLSLIVLFTIFFTACATPPTSSTATNFPSGTPNSLPTKTTLPTATSTPTASSTPTPEPTPTEEPTATPEPTPTPELTPTLAPGEYPPLPEDKSQWEQDTMYTMTKEDGTKVEVFLSRGQGELVEVQTSAFIEKIFEAKGGPVGAMSMDEFSSYTEGEVVSYEFDWDTVIDVNTAVVFGVVEDVSSFKDMSWLRVLVPGPDGKYRPILFIKSGHGNSLYKIDESGVIQEVNGRGGALNKFSEINEARQLEIDLTGFNTRTDDESATIKPGQVITFLVEIGGGENSSTYEGIMDERKASASSASDLNKILEEGAYLPYVEMDEEFVMVAISFILGADQFKQ